ncbi:MAG TPA: proton-conducting transporter membrane subunit [Gemmata sp.]|jgi:formate hydrogenlyase subunit 3/multisubunit Na+/H+ antiporter MnhD subunit|nr:proton-conducting transporter membrane subunit [Gemmata sp.]
MDVMLWAIALQLVAGTTALLLTKKPYTATLIGAGGTVLGCSACLVPTLRVLLGGATESLRLDWDKAHGAFVVEVDQLSAFFLLPALGLSILAAIYGADYLLAYRQKKSLGISWFFFNLFVAGLVMVLVARTAFLFLVVWEIMSLAAYFLVTFEHEKAEVRKAGWVYLVAAHLGVAFLIIAFTLLGRNAGSLEFEAFRSESSQGIAFSGLIFLLAVIGFGVKAGFVPLHVWLPEAHSAAPSHVSALMSGVMIKAGIYGILRVLTFLGQPDLWWGPTLAGVGLLTALVGISLSLQQRDIKRVLAYSSIENIGLIGLAFGIGIWGCASNLQVVAALGMAAGLLHIWNHALMKGLMFFAAGSILHGSGTKDMEKLGGLMKRMPWTAGAMMVGAVAISALPPMNGFVSKWLIYLGLLNCGLSMKGSNSLPAFLAIGLLSLVGGLAVVSFVRLIGIVLLGSPRAENSRNAHESSPWLLTPMLLLVFLCFSTAMIPQTVTELMYKVIDQTAGLEAGQALTQFASSGVHLAVIGNINIGTSIAFAAGLVGLMVWTRLKVHSVGPTWGCGYAKPTARMQYTGRSFTEMITERLLPRFLRPRTARRAPQGLFPTHSAFTSETNDPVNETIYGPFFLRWAEWFSRLRFLQKGQVHIYLLYIALTVVLALSWASVRRWWAVQ